MYTGLLHLHNLLRWVILILLLISMVQAFQKSEGLKKTSLFLLISAHITLLIGLYQWAVGGLGWALFEANGGAVMKDSTMRFWAVEHPITMIAGIVCITIARGKAKKSNFKAASILYVIALVLILAAVPWPFREVGRAWFPGMTN